VMNFGKMAKGEHLFELLLEEGSVMILSGESRWQWLHGIGRRPHYYNGAPVPSGRRTSVTLRRVLSSKKPKFNRYSHAISAATAKEASGVKCRNAANFYQEYYRRALQRSAANEPLDEEERILLDFHLRGYKWRDFKDKDGPQESAIRHRFDAMAAEDKARALA